ncbi:hypothetical protein M413DRAFT_439033, partial [Hebeloma cylindrosporum]
MVFVPTASISDVPTTICRASCESGRDSGFDEAEYERRDGAANAVQPGNDVVIMHRIGRLKVLWTVVTSTGRCLARNFFSIMFTPGTSISHLSQRPPWMSYFTFCETSL